jgi:hypothetical protein
LPRKRLRFLVVALLLPLLALRALIPVGLMPMAGADGSISLQLCPGTVPAVAGHAQFWHGASGDMASHHHRGEGHGPAHSHQTVCPFAALASPACTVTVLAITTEAMRDAFISSRESEQVFFSTLRRTQSPRAPPRFG